ncbi:hypothetical protein MNBD_PLANCTO02-3188, partial [hydrothermal vent metagenome]
MLTEQDFKDLEEVAKRGVRNVYIIQELAKEGEFDSLENMLARLTHSRNELITRFPSVSEYLSETHVGWVEISEGVNAETAHHLTANLIYNLWDAVQFALNPDDHRWDIDNPNILRIEN